MIQVTANVIAFNRTDCGLAPESPAWDADPAQLHEFIVHHTTGSNLGHGDVIEWWRNIKTFHVDQLGYDDIAYCWGVARGNGDNEAWILEGRGWGKLGAHTLGHNSSGVGVVLLGDGREADNLTPAVLSAFSFLQYVHSQMDLWQPQEVLLHNQVFATACPGGALGDAALSGWAGAAHDDGVPAPGPAPAGDAPAWPGRFITYPPVMHGDDVRTWQGQMAWRGWQLDVDGAYGPQSWSTCLAFQREKGLDIDGIVGPATWAAAWTEPIT